MTRRRVPWGLMALLVFAMVVSFFDRGNLAVAAPVLGPELGLSPWLVGVLLSAFFWTYAASQVGAGWLVDRAEVRTVYAIGFLVWSLATLGSAYAGSFAGLLAMRLLLGVGESVTYPATSRILAAVVPEHRRGLANSLVDLGARLGPAAGTTIGALLVAGLGWRGLFLVTGSLGLVWLVPWWLAAPRTLAAPGSPLPEDAPGLERLLRNRSFWGTCGGLCGANYAWYFLLTWLPSYLVRERHFTLRSLALWGALPYLCMAVTSMSGGILADRLISRGGVPVKVRRGLLVTGLLLTSAILPCVLLPRIGMAVAALFGACLSFGVYASNVFSLTQSLAGPAASGRWTGFQNACGNIAGIASPMVAGWIVARTGSLAVAFLTASAACLLGAASFGLLVRERDRLSS